MMMRKRILPLGMAVFIGIPVCAFIIYDIIHRQRSSGRKERCPWKVFRRTESS